MKRKDIDDDNGMMKKSRIDDDFRFECKKNFYTDSSNVIARNTICMVGSLFATIDSEEANKVSHVVLNSIKRKNVKATNQGQTGRCWMFAGLNMFRHMLIEALNLENFEFSESYLFFWDKFERSNCFLRWISKEMNEKSFDILDNKLFQFLIDKEKWMGDGGYWTYFANLVTKYGLVPKNVFPETFQSESSHEMNEVIMDILQRSANEMYQKGHHDIIIETTLKQIYSVLVKFLGQPPEIFNFEYINEENESNSLQNMTPITFRDMVLPNLDLNDFVVLSNIPVKKYPYYKLFHVENTNNVIEGKNFTYINLPSHELKKYATKSILAGIGVWFGADVNKSYNPILSSLDEKVMNEDLVFGKKYPIDKEHQILFKNTEVCHAMTFTGVNLDHKYRPISFQVENSWSYCDNTTIGQDGFLAMSDEWFDKYVGQVVVHKRFLSRQLQKILTQKPIVLPVFDVITPALYIKNNLYQQNVLRKKFLKK